MKNKLITAAIMLVLLCAYIATPRSAHATGPNWAFVVVGQSNAVLMCPYLAASITAYYGPDALTICAAVNGSSIASWQPGQTNYTSAVNQVLAAEANGYTIKAVIFSQGEYDAEFTSSNNWAAQAATFLDNFRLDIGSQYQYLPVVYTELGKQPVVPAGFQNYVNWQVIRKAQHELRYNRSNFFMVDKAPYDVYDTTAAPYAHDVPSALQAITNQVMIYLRGWVPAP